jgi:Ca2+ transporting ATPase
VGSESPISAIQMLWINLIMDSLGSLSLATEEPTDELLNRKPYSKREYIISSIMWKHLLFQSLCQFLLVFLLYLYAPYFITENDPTRVGLAQQLENCFGDFPGEKISYKNNHTTYYILDGKKSSWGALQLIIKGLDSSYCMFYDTTRFEPQQIKSLNDAYRWINTEYGNTVHMTIIFNAFVLYALFNQINSRILDDSFNIFKRIHKNLLFLIIIIAEFAIQYIMVQHGGLIFKCTVGGLTTSQWLICILLWVQAPGLFR